MRLSSLCQCLIEGERPTLNMVAYATRMMSNSLDLALDLMCAMNIPPGTFISPEFSQEMEEFLESEEILEDPQGYWEDKDKVRMDMYVLEAALPYFDVFEGRYHMNIRWLHQAQVNPRNMCNQQIVMELFDNRCRAYFIENDCVDTSYDVTPQILLGRHAVISAMRDMIIFRMSCDE